MITLEIEYPRFILAELNTHRMLSKNSASSRAIPVNRMLELMQDYSAEPVWWGKNEPGMQAKQELSPLEQTAAYQYWIEARDDAMWNARQLADLKLHKQIVNRVCEPWQMMKTVISGTEWANLWQLRNHPDAQPEFQELAQCMQISVERSRPQLLLPGEWHLPYVVARRVKDKVEYSVGNTEVSLETAQWISSSCCAQVSYRKLDDSPEKAKQIFDKLIFSDPPHMSPVEHQATPQPAPSYNPREGWAPGITHQDRTGQRWSGNLRGWIQYRKLLPNEAKW